MRNRKGSETGFFSSLVTGEAKGRDRRSRNEEKTKRHSVFPRRRASLRKRLRAFKPGKDVHNTIHIIGSNKNDINQNIETGKSLFFKTWSMEKLDALIGNALPEALKLLESYRCSRRKEVAARYILLFLRGGMVLSRDVEIIRDTTNLIYPGKFLACRDRKGIISCDYMAAPAGHPFLAKLILSLFDSPKMLVSDACGNKLLTRVFQESNPKDVMIVPKLQFYSSVEKGEEDKYLRYRCDKDEASGCEVDLDSPTDLVTTVLTVGEKYREPRKIYHKRFQGDRTRIPKIIHQTWKSFDNLSGVQIHCMNELRRLNPEYEYWFWNDQSCDELVKQFGPDLYWAYEGLVPGAYKADIWRACALYAFGGIYFDMDLQPQLGCRDLIKGENELCLPRDAGKGMSVWNAVLASVKGHQIWEVYLGLVITRVRYASARVGEGVPRKYGQLWMTGPGCVGRAAQLVNARCCMRWRDKIRERENRRMCLRSGDTFVVDCRMQKKGNTKNFDWEDYVKLWREGRWWRGASPKIDEHYVLCKTDNIVGGQCIHAFLGERSPYARPCKIIPARVTGPDRLVPKIIHQTWKTWEGLKGEQLECKDKLIELNPDHDYWFWDDQACDNLVAQFGPLLYDAYSSLIPGAFRADVWRVCVLYAYGGVYMDMDIVPLLSIDQLISKSDDMVLAQDLSGRNGEVRVWNAVMACSPEQEMWRAYMSLVLRRIAFPISQRDSLWMTGPGCTGRAAELTGCADFGLIWKGNLCDENGKTQARHMCLPDGRSFLADVQRGKQEGTASFNWENYAERWRTNKWRRAPTSLRLPKGSTIPGILHVTNRDISDLPEHVIPRLRACLPGYHLTFWDDIDGSIAVRAVFGTTGEEMLRNTDLGCHKADLIRYAVLYLYGGVYLDSDILPIGNLAGIVKGSTLTSCMGAELGLVQPVRTIFQAFIAATAGDGILLEWGEDLLKNYTKGRIAHVESLWRRRTEWRIDLLEEVSDLSRESFFEKYCVVDRDGMTLFHSRMLEYDRQVSRFASAYPPNIPPFWCYCNDDSLCRELERNLLSGPLKKIFSQLLRPGCTFSEDPEKLVEKGLLPSWSKRRLDICVVEDIEVRTSLDGWNIQRFEKESVGGIESWFAERGLDIKIGAKRDVLEQSYSISTTGLFQ